MGKRKKQKHRSQQQQQAQPPAAPLKTATPPPPPDITTASPPPPPPVTVMSPPSQPPPDEAAAAAAAAPTGVEKTKEQILAEREAKKAAKAAKKAGGNKAPATGDKGAAPKQSTEGGSGEAPPQKSKAELKAERRAKQEAQRAAKGQDQTADKKDAKVQDAKAPAPAPAAAPAPAPAAAESKSLQSQASQSKLKGGQQRVPDEMQADRPSVNKKLNKKLASAKIPARTNAQRKVMLFSHLHQYERELSLTRELPAVGGTIHPAVLQLGLQFAEGTVSGSNARCVALLHTLKKVINDYVTPKQKELARDLDCQLKPYITFLRQCRTLSVSMGNAIRFLKARINQLSPELSDAEAKQQLIEAIDNFVHENIVLAARQIAITARDKVVDGAVILTYGCSSLLRFVFEDLAKQGLNFRVIVADGRPRFEGRQMVRHLVNANIDCSYVQLSGVPYVMPEVSVVFLGAHAVLANGCVMSRVGTSQVAMIAKASNVPVQVLCETYKFSERVQTDSFVFNELGDPDYLVNTGRPSFCPLQDWRDFSSLCLLNLSYDVTPASLVDAIISEISVIPTTSVPVVLRLKNSAC